MPNSLTLRSAYVRVELDRLLDDSGRYDTSTKPASATAKRFIWKPSFFPSRRVGVWCVCQDFKTVPNTFHGGEGGKVVDGDSHQGLPSSVSMPGPLDFPEMCSISDHFFLGFRRWAGHLALEILNRSKH